MKKCTLEKLMNKVNKNEQITDQVLAGKVANLANELSPQRDLWAGIERAIQDKPQQLAEREPADASQKVPFIPVAWAASIVAAVLVTWLSLSPSVEQSKALIVNNNDVPLSTEPFANDQLVTIIQDDFSQQKQAMLVSFGQPDLKQLPAKMQVQLAQLAQARLTIEKALQSDNNNVDLLNLLRFTQQQELNLLQQLLPYMGSNAVKWQTI